ncbi:TPA: hypothetical protein ACXJTR_005094, partial [Pseudomonas aeruginosa]
RKPGGASRRHAQVVPDFQAGNADMLLMKWARPTLRGMHATSRKLPAHGVPIRLSASNTGRGHCRARICISPRPGRNGLGAVLIAVIPSFR